MTKSFTSTHRITKLLVDGTLLLKLASSGEYYTEDQF